MRPLEEKENRLRQTCALLSNCSASSVLSPAPVVYFANYALVLQITQMLFTQCKFFFDMMKRLNNFLFFFDLRQGVFIISYFQIALAAFALFMLFVGLPHVGEMLTMLHNDMKDDAERHGFYQVAHGNELTFHEGDVISTVNQRRFAKAQHLASMTVIIIHTSTILTSIYFICSVSLLYGAMTRKKEYLYPWIIAATIDLVLLITAIVAGDGYPCIVKLFSGYSMYYFTSAMVVASFVYTICAVISFVQELRAASCARHMLADERGERLLLLDHTTHSSLLSAAQLDKLSHGTRTQFV